MQTKKRHVQSQIEDAALELFATRGYQATSMAQVAEAAGVAVGNLYRYFDTKAELFAAVVPEKLIVEGHRLLMTKVHAAHGLGPARVGRSAAIVAENDRLLAFLLQHRRQLLAAYRHGAGTVFADLETRTLTLIVRLVRNYAASHRAHGIAPLSPVQKRLLPVIYTGLLRGTLDLLESKTSAQALRAALDLYLRYHFAGLAAFFK